MLSSQAAPEHHDICLSGGDCLPAWSCLGHGPGGGEGGIDLDYWEKWMRAQEARASSQAGGRAGGVCLAPPDPEILDPACS